jgi:hypothetical protein
LLGQEREAVVAAALAVVRALVRVLGAALLALALVLVAAGLGLVLVAALVAALGEEPPAVRSRINGQRSNTKLLPNAGKLSSVSTVGEGNPDALK